MRTSIMSRSLITVAGLAVASATLAAAPANAETSIAVTPNGITREQVLTAAAGVRVAPTGTSSGLFFSLYDPATNRALRAMANRACVIDPDGPELSFGSIAAATVSGGSAEGVVVSAFLVNTDSAASSSPQGRLCSFGALAATDSRGVLSGTATLTGLPPAALSGDVFVTSPINASLAALSDSTFVPPTFSASGTSTVTLDTKVADKKSTKQKKAAKATYDKRLKAAKKAYVKALDKAGSSKAKKSKAKKAYSAAKSKAKSNYKYAVANYKIVKKSTGTPFSVSATVTALSAP